MLQRLFCTRERVETVNEPSAHAAEATFHKANGQVLMHAKIPMTQDPQCVKTFRDEVALCCIKEAQHLYPQAITFHFDTPIAQVDLHRQTVHAGSTGPNATQVRCPGGLLPAACNCHKHVNLHAVKLVS